MLKTDECPQKILAQSVQPFAWPAIRNIYILYTNVLFYYIDIYITKTF